MPLLFAHLMQTGFGGFYDGIAHVFLTPSDLLLVLGLALLAGQQGPQGGRLLLTLLPLSWWIGLAVGQRWGLDQTLALFTTVLFSSVGVLVALSLRLSPPVFAFTVAGSGLLFGVINGFTMPSASIGLPLDVLGVVSAVAVLSVLISAQVAATRSTGFRIAVRVAGSWIAAAGLLSLGLLFKAA